MISIIAGVALTGAACATFWFLLPRDGKVNPLIEMPVFDSMIPIGIITGIAVGVALIFSGLA